MTRYSQLIYVRKKFEGKRKWIPVGHLHWNGEVTLTITRNQIKALVDNAHVYFAGRKEELEKLFE